MASTRYVDVEGGLSSAHLDSSSLGSDIGHITDESDITISALPITSLAADLSVSTRIRAFSFPALGGAAEEVFSLKILTFLGSADLCSLAATCTFFNHISKGVHLWTVLCLKDFIIDDETISSDHASGAGNGNSFYIAPVTKFDYLRRYHDRHNRIEQAKQEDIVSRAEASKEAVVLQIQKIVDITQLRILVPLPVTAVFLSLLLFALHIDGYDISIWGCAAPLLFFVAYLIVSIIFVVVIHKKQHTTSSILSGLWSNMRGPIKSFFVELLGESSRLSYITVLVIFVSISQIILIAVKLSPTSIVSHNIVSHFNWGEVFAPMWMLFLIYCVSPLVSCITEPGIFIFGILFFWVPFFVLFVCLTLKLNAEDHHNSNNLVARMRMALIFMPFWIIEGIAMLSAFTFLAFGIYRKHRGFLDRLDEHIGVFLTSWFVMGPFAIFQALICARDDGHTHDVKASIAVIPLLFLLGWLLLCTIAFAIKFRTPFQDAREANLRAAAGTIILFDV